MEVEYFVKFMPSSHSSVVLLPPHMIRPEPVWKYSYIVPFQRETLLRVR